MRIHLSMRMSVKILIVSSFPHVSVIQGKMLNLNTIEWMSFFCSIQFQYHSEDTQKEMWDMMREEWKWNKKEMFRIEMLGKLGKWYWGCGVFKRIFGAQSGTILWKEKESKNKARLHNFHSQNPVFAGFFGSQNRQNRKRQVNFYERVGSCGAFEQSLQTVKIDLNFAWKFRFNPRSMMPKN